MAEDRNNSRPNDVHTRLSAYYGPPLPEQPLSSGAWDRLSQQLGPLNRSRQNARSQWHGLRGLRRNVTHRAGMPSFIRESLVRVFNEARWNQISPPVLWSIRSDVREPSLRIRSRLLLGRPVLKVVLPVDAPIRMQNLEIDVLLAAGLARIQLMQRLTNRLVRYALACLLLLGCFAVMYGLVHNQLYTGLLIAGVLFSCVALWWNVSHRRQVFMADRIIVNWMGRSQVCEGLHDLASRRRKRPRFQWNEPSLEERIKRVCGTRVTARDRDLTLVG